MRVMLLGLAVPLAATITAVVPAQAQTFVDPVFASRPAVLPSPTSPSGPFVSGDFRHRHGDRHHRRNDVIAGGWGWYDPDFNRSWASDSFNDWWHDRPDRAYPKWVWHNDNCDRMFWAGGGWRCSM